MSLENFSNLFGADLVKKIYEDGLSPAVQDAGVMLSDVVKGLRLVTAPFQLMAAYQVRLTKYLDKVRDAVPEDRQIEAPAFISGPIIDKLKYLEETNYLTDLYLNLLSRAIDKERVNEAHPAFLHIIDQLSPDEAYFLYRLKDKEIDVETTKDYDSEKDYFSNYKIIKTDLPPTEFTFPENFNMYYSHLESLNLVKWPVYTHIPILNENKSIQIGIIEKSKLKTTEFGKLFIKACIPEKGFILYKKD